ncbi:MAG: hypothetical protein KatS3mg012_0600 [Gaiellaceae bacterium]|nr:MAG: hypothetical protein KatS3mg012_0600 [Gaiellaceae bacterium]
MGTAHFRRSGLLAVAVGAAVILVGLVGWQVVGGGDRGDSADGPGPVHVHALGINPADEALFIATHTGLYRVSRGEDEASRVGDRYQDTMGFTVVGSDRFLGSGHPDLRDDLPPHLGLIESTDAGVTWEPISLLGEADFHVLRLADERLYGYDASNDRLLVSEDLGRTWSELEKPGPVVDLVVSPVDPARIVLASAGGREEGLFASKDGGRTWKRIHDVVGLLAWPAPEHLYALASHGEVLESADRGRSFEPSGEIGGDPAAFLAASASELYVALHDGTIKRTTDGGARWTIRSAP